MSSNPAGPVSTQIPKQRVLLVDDSKIVRTTLARLIRKSFDVREEANGETGWQAIATDPSIVWCSPTFRCRCWTGSRSWSASGSPRSRAFARCR